MYKYSSDNEVLTSAQRSAGTGTTTFIPAKSYNHAIAVIYITGKSGAPTLEVTLQCSPVNPELDNSKWRNVYVEDLITDAMIGTSYPKIFGGHVQEDFTGWLRLKYVIAGASTPKLTFSCNIEIK